MQIRALIDFLALCEKLKCQTRHAVTSTGRAESVAEHSWRLALMAFLVSDEFPELDRDKVIQMCLIHDLGEAVTGDIPTFVKTDADEQTEQDALGRVLEALPEAQQAMLEPLFAEMEAQQTQEARLYKALDKLEAVIQHNEADISTWLPLEYELQLTHGTQECALSPYLKALREAVAENTRRKIDEAGA